MELGVQGQRYFSGTDVQEFILVILCAAEFANYFSKRIVLSRTKGWKVIYYQVMYSEDVCQLDVECRFRSCIQIVECINVVLSLGVTNRNN